MSSYFPLQGNLVNLIERLGGPGIFVFCLLVYYAVFLITGFIPVNGGAGFDGSVYLDYIIRLSSGEEILDDPYRLMRLSGFLPAILMAKLGFDTSKLIAFQAILNALMLSLGVSIFYCFVKTLVEIRLNALMATFVLFFSWPFLVMPIYYPILSDHIALFAAIVSLWAWLKSYYSLQYLLIFVCVWIMPGLFYLPLLLSALPYQRSRGLGKSRVNAAALCFLFVTFIAFSAYLWTNLTGLSDSEIVNHPPGFDLGRADLRDWSSIFVLFALSFSALAWGLLFSNSSFWKVFDPRRFILGGVAAAAGFISVAFLIDWGSGFRGPPLYYFMLLQSVAAPAKPLVSHFLHFGPVILVAMLSMGIFRDTFFRGAAFPLGVVFTAYLPLLILGSESRQWMAVFPLAVALVALNERSTRALLVIFVFSVFLCIPAVFLREGVSAAFGSGLDYMSNGWQYYFGRQGPWISNRTYTIGFVLIFLFLSFYLMARSEGIKATPNRFGEEVK